MKIQLNTIEKTIKLEENIKLGELFSKLEEMFPDLTWREYTLETGCTIVWNNPIQITPILPQQPYIPHYPWQEPWITYVGDTSCIVNIDIT